MDSDAFKKARQLTHWENVDYSTMTRLVHEKFPETTEESLALEKCSICQFEYTEEDTGIVRLSKCNGLHFFHDECIELCRQGKNFIKCPNCMVIYGRYFGSMPHGQMEILKDPMSLPGYGDCGTIVIDYRFPTQSYNRLTINGIHRVAFLPDNREGNHVLSLLVRAFHARVTFTVGRSVTTGRDNVIVWNGIHHKTNVEGGSSNFGYPDATYLSRVQEELKAVGIS